MGNKNSGVGTTWAVKQEKLPQALEQEKERIKQLLGEFKPQLSNDDLILIQEPLREINKVFETWINLYHCLVLLAAANRPPLTIRATLNTPGVVATGIKCDQGAGEGCLECGYGLPSFRFIDRDEQSKFQFLDFSISDSDDQLKLENHPYVKDFNIKFSQENLTKTVTNADVIEKIAQVNRVDNNFGELPLLQSFLTKCKDLLSDLDQFDPARCIEKCQDSVPHIRQQTNDESNDECNDIPEIQDYVDEVLDHIRALWGDDDNIRERLTEVQSWLNEVQSWLDDNKKNSELFQNWLRNKHQVVSSSGTQDVLMTAVKSDNDRAKLVVNAMNAILDFNMPIFRFIYGRCFDSVGGWPPVSFEQLRLFLITDVMSEEEQNQWANLFSATYGVISWQIFNQVTPTLRQLKKVLDGV